MLLYSILLVHLHAYYHINYTHKFCFQKSNPTKQCHICGTWVSNSTHHLKHMHGLLTRAERLVELKQFRGLDKPKKPLPCYRRPGCSTASSSCSRTQPQTASTASSSFSRTQPQTSVSCSGEPCSEQPRTASLSCSGESCSGEPCSEQPPQTLVGGKLTMNEDGEYMMIGGVIAGNNKDIISQFILSKFEYNYNEIHTIYSKSLRL